MEMRFILIHIIFFNILFSYNELHYRIKYLGVHAADCIITNKDTIYNNELSQVINFKVKTRKIVNYFFPIENNYKIILNKENYILFYKKNTIQPNLKNYFETELRNNNVFYKNTELQILPEYFNIFSMLHLLMIDKDRIPDNFILEREGLLYNAEINKKDNIYFLSLYLNDVTSKKLIENTDIFTWALFKDKAKRKIYFSKNHKYIQKCIFSKGLISMSAILQSYK